MTERKHNLQDRYDRLGDQITEAVLDSIVVNPRSHGRLHMPGEYSTDNRHPAHEVKVTSMATDNQGVYYEERLLGSPDRYRVTYDVWNYRDSHSRADLILTETARAQDDTPRVSGSTPCHFDCAGTPHPLQAWSSEIRHRVAYWRTLLA